MITSYELAKMLLSIPDIPIVGRYRDGGTTRKYKDITYPVMKVGLRKSSLSNEVYIETNYTDFNALVLGTGIQDDY